MPKTLAALPRSQYATDLWLVSGKKVFFTSVDVALAPTVLLREFNGAAAPLLEAIVLCIGVCVD